MRDTYLESFLEHQFGEAMELANNSDILELLPLGGKPYNRYIARFHCAGLVKTETGFDEHNLFDIGIYFPDEYVRHIEPKGIVTLLYPMNVYHPNVLFPYFCVGHLYPRMPLVDILYQAYEILSYQKFTPVESNAWNKEACIWARNNLARFPLDRRPLKRSRFEGARTHAAPPAPDLDSKKEKEEP